MDALTTSQTFEVIEAAGDSASSNAPNREPTIMDTLSTSQAFQVVDAFAYNLSSYVPNTILQGRQSSKAHNTHFHKLLDALVCFIRTGKKVFALTLTDKEDEVIATVAANEPDHLLDVPRVLGPVTILEKIWPMMVECSGTTKKDAENTRLSIYIIETHFGILSKRLKRWEKSYVAFRKRCPANTVTQESTSTLNTYLTTINTIYSSSLALHDAYDKKTRTLPEEAITNFLDISQMCKKLSTQEAALTVDDRRVINIAEGAPASGKGE